MRRMERHMVREAVVVGAVVGAASHPKPVVYGVPPPVVVVPPPRPPTTVIVEAPAPYPPGAYPPPAAYPPGAYPPGAYPPRGATGYPPGPLPPQPGYGYPPQPGYPPGAYPPGAYPPGPHPPAVVEVARPPPVAPVVATAAAVGVAATAVALAERRHFYIVNEANCSVMEVVKPGALHPVPHAIVDKRHPQKAAMQVWYMGPDGIIRAKLNDMALECTKRDDKVRLVPFTGEARQMWTFEGNRIVNKVVKADCLGLRKHLRLKDDADVIMCAYEGKPFQHWRMEPCM